MNKNDITGDRLITRVVSDSYRKGWDLIFAEKEEEPQDPSHHCGGNDQSPENCCGKCRNEDQS